MITTTTKTELKLNKIYFDNGHLIDSNGEFVDLNKQLQVAFGNTEFNLSASVTVKSEYEAEAEDESLED